MWGVTPLDQLWCRIEFKKMRYEGHFTVPGADTIFQFPGNAGGHNWGSVSIDQVNNIMVVNPLVLGNQLTLIPRDELPEGQQGNQLGTPYSHRTVRFMSPLGIPCNQPPFGVLAAIDLETKQLLWERPIGTAKESGPFGIKTRLPITVGTPAKRRHHNHGRWADFQCRHLRQYNSCYKHKRRKGTVECGSAFHGARDSHELPVSSRRADRSNYRSGF